MWGRGPRMGIKFPLSMSVYHYRYVPATYNDSDTNDNKHTSSLGYQKKNRIGTDWKMGLSSERCVIVTGNTSHCACVDYGEAV